VKVIKFENIKNLEMNIIEGQGQLNLNNQDQDQDSNACVEKECESNDGTVSLSNDNESQRDNFGLDNDIKLGEYLFKCSNDKIAKYRYEGTINLNYDLKRKNMNIKTMEEYDKLDHQ